MKTPEVNNGEKDPNWRRLFLGVLSGILLGVVASFAWVKFDRPSLHPASFCGVYEFIVPPGGIHYIIRSDGIVEEKSWGPMTLESEAFGFWHQTARNVFVLTIQKDHPSVGSYFSTFFIRSDLDRKDVFLFPSLDEALAFRPDVVVK